MTLQQTRSLPNIDGRSRVRHTNRSDLKRIHTTKLVNQVGGHNGTKSQVYASDLNRFIQACRRQYYITISTYLLFSHIRYIRMLG